MARGWRVYYNIILGGFGGLLGWLIAGALPDLIQNALFWELLTGAVVGASIGGWLGLAEGLLGKRPARMLGGAFIGATLGLIGGVIGLAIGEGVFLLTRGGILGRAIGWGLVGAIVGTPEGIAHRAPRKIIYGACGGLLGGVLGGAGFEVLTQAGLTFASAGGAFDPSFVVQMQTAAAALGLLLVGACVGALVAWVEEIFVRAWLKVVRGKQEGRDFNLVKRVMTIGGDDANDIPVYDPRVGNRFAVVRQDGKRVRVECSDATATLLRAGTREPLAITSPQTLADGDKILVGDTALLFRQK